ncbi:hypothetical protein LTR37_019969 [Vermiconidia calcicola]|uniref:Uncharacterized protein n=1 Tax=Vermiconidia calcicola TaxID=1690605 RepID=A0ACC3MDR3_9PEZI|nr:hypothetical protein LTR37_019969 [Vermiconidia calcicola]
MANTYSAFLQAPSASHLASDASLNYITTTTVISEPHAILKHLQAQAKQIAKKEERVLNAIEGPDSLFLETETTLQFQAGGGAYLPSMDENLLDEKLVTFPVMHVVSFDAEQKIKQIRLHWDQGTLLRQVEAIGKTGRNWPIRDGKAQVDAITNSLKSGGVTPNPKQQSGARNGHDVIIREHKKQESVSAMRDPKASLDLFAPRDPNEDARGDYQDSKVAPRASAKPPPRNYNELFSSGEAPNAVPGSQVRNQSPSRTGKSGAGQHYAGNRIFDDSEQTGMARSPERKKVFNQKYDHFTFGDGEDEPKDNRPTSNRGTKAQPPTWNFEDFATPPKVQGKARPDDEVHWGGEDPPSPPKRPIVHAARKDADSHFKFTDDSSPATGQNQTKSLQRQRGMQLYEDPTADYDTQPAGKASRNNTTGTDNNRRGNDFAPHTWMTDSGTQNENVAPKKSADDNGNWAFSETKPPEKIYRTAGDGMGSRKGDRDWMTGEGEKKIYRTAGDSMGGRSTGGGGRSWGIGDDSGM